MSDAHFLSIYHSVPYYSKQAGAEPEFWIWGVMRCRPMFFFLCSQPYVTRCTFQLFGSEDRKDLVSLSKWIGTRVIQTPFSSLCPHNPLSFASALKKSWIPMYPRISRVPRLWWWHHVSGVSYSDWVRPMHAACRACKALLHVQLVY